MHSAGSCVIQANMNSCSANDTQIFYKNKKSCPVHCPCCSSQGADKTYGWLHVMLLSHWWRELECKLNVFIATRTFTGHSSTVTQPKSTLSLFMLNFLVVSWIFHSHKLYSTHKPVIIGLLHIQRKMTMLVPLINIIRQKEEKIQRDEYNCCYCSRFVQFFSSVCEVYKMKKKCRV